MPLFKPSFEFKYKPSYYTTQGAETLARKDMSALRKEYTRMRDVAQKRVQRLQKEYDWTKSAQQSYKIETKEGTEIRQGFPKLSEIRPENLAKAFQELAHFVKYSGSTVTGQKSMQEKTTETLNKNIGGKKVNELPESKRPVNKKNYQRFIQVMNETRRLKISTLYGSDTIREMVDRTLSLSKDDFDTVLDHLGSFLDHARTVDKEMDAYRADHEGEFDMQDFIEQMGW